MKFTVALLALFFVFSISTFSHAADYDYEFEGTSKYDGGRCWIGYDLDNNGQLSNISVEGESKVFEILSETDNGYRPVCEVRDEDFDFPEDYSAAPEKVFCRNALKFNHVSRNPDAGIFKGVMSLRLGGRDLLLPTYFKFKFSAKVGFVPIASQKMDCRDLVPLRGL